MMNYDCIIFSIENALNKLLDQFIKCKFFGCVHPIFRQKNYATSEDFFQDSRYFVKTDRRYYLCQDKMALAVGVEMFSTHF